jgi:lysyl-tRNA synthetase class II
MTETEPTNQYEQERRQKLLKLKELGVDPYGQRTEGLTPLAAIKAQYTPEMGHDGGPVVKGAGRVVLKRDMGKLSFLTLRDESGDLQVAFDKKRLSERDWEVNELIDLGDQIVIEGKLGTTRKGETTVWAGHDPIRDGAIAMAAKALLPPPAKWEGLSDVEARYRQRYVDLWANPDVMKTLKLRMQIVEEIRSYMKEKGFLEVETPMMQTLHGGAAARPFVTHHNALDTKLYMRIAPELFLKRLLVGGFTKIFELNRNFRNEGISPRHNPEFTMLEAYEAFGNWETMADLVEGMICHIAEKLFGGLKIEHHDSAGMRSVDAYISHRTETNVEAVCRARLELLNRRTDIHPTALEQRALETASQGYARGQAGFDELFTELRSDLDRLAYASERRALLASKFVTRTISLARPWRRVSMVELVEKRARELGDIDFKFLKQKFLNVSPGLLAGLLSREINWALHLFPDDGPHEGDFRSPERRKIDEADARRILAAILIGQAKPPEEEEFYWILFQAELPRLLARLKNLSPAEELTEVYEKLIEPTLIDPTFVTQVPSVIIPLARKNREDEFFADVYELAINGQEISPGYTELNDPDVQAANFSTQVGDKEEQQKVDDDFLNALRYGMPPAGGLGLGIDRLVMMLTGAESIRDVILFPLMKPQG